jgi:hypothetical protein
MHWNERWSTGGPPNSGQERANNDEEISRKTLCSQQTVVENVAVEASEDIARQQHSTVTPQAIQSNH